jgi:hypothetical protein
MGAGYPGLRAFVGFVHPRGVKVVVSGGTGFIGQRLVAALEARGDDVVVLSRSGSADGKRVQWTPTEEGPWMDVVGGADAVVHLAGAGVADERWTAERKIELRASRVLPTRLVARAIARAKKRPGVLVSASAVGYYGFRDDDVVLDESSPPGTDFLAETCVQWEGAADAAREAGTRVVHPRIGIVLGRESGALKEMLPPFRAFVGGPLGHGKQQMSWIHADDAVRALVFALDRSELSGPVDLTAPNPVSMDEFARTLGRVLHRPAFARVPALAVEAMLGKERAQIVLAGQRVLPRVLQKAGFEFRFQQLEDALRDLLA